MYIPLPTLFAPIKSVLTCSGSYNDLGVIEGDKKLPCQLFRASFRSIVFVPDTNVSCIEHTGVKALSWEGNPVLTIPQ